jgi:hypothetical protein
MQKSKKHLCDEMDDRIKVTRDHIGIFRDNPRPLGQPAKIYYYYATPKGETSVRIQGKQWFESISEGTDLLNIRLTKSNNLILISPPMITNLYPQPTKKRKLEPAFIEVSPLSTSTEDNQQSLVPSSLHSPSSRHQPGPRTQNNLSLLLFSLFPPAPQSPNIWWESPEAKRLFRAQEGESTFYAVLEQIDILKTVNRTESSYLSIISGGEKVDKSTLSSYVVHAIRQKCALLCIALKLAVENMNEWSWNMCCKRALQAGERVGITIVKNPKSVEKWYRALETNAASIYHCNKNTTYLLSSNSIQMLAMQSKSLG